MSEIPSEEQRDLFGEVVEKNALLRDKFIEPPFTILHTMGGDWQNRKRQWKSLGIKSEVGRNEGLLGNGSTNSTEQDKAMSDKYGRSITNGVGIFDKATSVFDPALCELMYRWFCPEGGQILDPFAGGSVRGIVANYIGFKYTGIDLRAEQIESNREQALEILPINNQPNWYIGDSVDFLENAKWQSMFDFIFSCPPYLDLEVYSDLPADLSNKSDKDFEALYQRIINCLYVALKPGSFAVFVVGDVRDKKGYYRCFPEMTTRCFLNAGFKLYNKAILAQPCCVPIEFLAVQKN